MIIIAIETTCDDTCISIMEQENIILTERISSEKLLSKYGGIVPEIVAREHGKNINLIINNLNTKFDLSRIDFVAYASEPGLAGSLHVGEIFAKTLAWYYGIEIIKINHVIAHCFSAFIGQREVEYPFLSLIASGGSTSLYLITSAEERIELVKKKDDALGEAFDKIGKLLGLKYPGGPEIDKIYDSNLVQNIFKKQAIESDFSFSGAKSKVKSLIDADIRKHQTTNIAMIASSFQDWAINLLIEKIKYYQVKFDIKIITIGGGVSSNSLWREKIKALNVEVISPLKSYCCDNSEMIGFLAFHTIKK